MSPGFCAWCLNWGLQASDAEDVAQEVLVKLFAAMSTFRYDPAKSFRAWLKTVTKHAWADFLSTRRKDPGRNAGPIEMIADSSQAQSDLERQVEEASDADLLERASRRVKKRVKPATWEAFELTVLQGLSGAEAARKLQIPVAHLFVFKNRVQKMLQEEIRILRNLPL